MCCSTTATLAVVSGAKAFPAVIDSVLIGGPVGRDADHRPLDLRLPAVDPDRQRGRGAGGDRRDARARRGGVGERVGFATDDDHVGKLRVVVEVREGPVEVVHRALQPDERGDAARHQHREARERDPMPTRSLPTLLGPSRSRPFWLLLLWHRPLYVIGSSAGKCGSAYTPGP